MNNKYVKIGLITLAILLVISLGFASYVYQTWPRESDADLKATFTSIYLRANYDILDSAGNFNKVCGVDGEEQFSDIKRLIDRIRSNYPDIDFVCGRPDSGSADAYAISSPLVTNPDLYFCIDSTGFQGEVARMIQENETQCPEEAVMTE